MSDDELMNTRAKVHRLLGLAQQFESDPDLHADFSELGLDVAWCRGQAEKIRNLAAMMESGEPQ